jgi:hypothetical protein
LPKAFDSFAYCLAPIAYFSLTPNPETLFPNFMKTQEGNIKSNRKSQELLSVYALMAAFFIWQGIAYA